MATIFWVHHSEMNAVEKNHHIYHNYHKTYFYRIVPLNSISVSASCAEQDAQNVWDKREGTIGQGGIYGALAK